MPFVAGLDWPTALPLLVDRLRPLSPLAERCWEDRHWAVATCSCSNFSRVPQVSQEIDMFVNPENKGGDLS